MKKYLNYIVFLFIVGAIFVLTCIPKILSIIWYGKYELDYNNDHYIVHILELAGSIVEFKD